MKLKTYQVSGIATIEVRAQSAKQAVALAKKRARSAMDDRKCLDISLDCVSDDTSAAVSLEDCDELDQ